jgi:hypothetical protein
MSTRERLQVLTDRIPDSKLPVVQLMLLQFLRQLEEEADDEICARMYAEFKADTDPEKWDGIPIEELAAEMGVAL